MLGDLNPMRNPDAVAKLSGKNHWRNRPENAQRAAEYAEEQRSRVGEQATNWQGGKTQTAAGYVKTRVGNKYVCEHRVLMEGKLGRPLQRREIVHHKDGDVSNNDLDNLELMESQSPHVALHNAQRKRKPLNQEEAPLCVCGCGQQVAESIKSPGRWNWFLPGHSYSLRKGRVEYEN